MHSPLFTETDVVLCIGHGASINGLQKALEAHLPEELKLKGDRTVSCYAEFEPLDRTVSSSFLASNYICWIANFLIFIGEFSPLFDAEFRYSVEKYHE